MNPWLAAGLAAAALWFLRMNSNAQQQAQNAQAGTQAGAGQTSDQGGGSAFTPNSTIIPYQGGVTQPISTVSYQPPQESSSGSSSGSSSSYYFAPPPDSGGSSPGYVSTPTAGGGYINPAYNQLPVSPVSALISNPYSYQFTSPQAASQPTRSGAQF